jgi:hypothetical protein
MNERGTPPGEDADEGAALRDLYSDLPSPEPSTALRARLEQLTYKAATPAVPAQDFRSRRRWRVPAALAASLAASITVGMLVYLQGPQQVTGNRSDAAVDYERAAPAAQPGAAASAANELGKQGSSIEQKARQAGQQQAPARQPAPLAAAASQRRDAVGRAEYAAPPRRASPPAATRQSPPATPPPGFASGQLREQASGAISAAPAPEASPAPENPGADKRLPENAPAPPARLYAPALAAVAPEPSVPAAAAFADTADGWFAEIQRREAAGQHASAMALFEQFKQRFPDDPRGRTPPGTQR